MNKNSGYQKFLTAKANVKNALKQLNLACGLTGASYDEELENITDDIMEENLKCSENYLRW